ncbi:Prim2, partial [Symbiodinium sp. CCMP2456]
RYVGARAYSGSAAPQNQHNKAVNEAPAATEMFLPHHLLPWGSPIFYFALVAVPLLCIYNEMQDSKMDEVNQAMREERLKRREEKLSAEQEEVSIREFEEPVVDFTVNRLKLLHLIDKACGGRSKAGTSSEFRLENMGALRPQLARDLRDCGLSLGYPKADRVNGFLLEKVEFQSRDNISHFALRLAFCKSNEAREWLLKQEQRLFVLRFEGLNTDAKEAFVESTGIRAQRFEEPSEGGPTLSMLQKCTAGVKTWRDGRAEVEQVFYAMSFTEVPPAFIAGRRVVVKKGKAYVPASSLKMIVAKKFKDLLAASLDVAFQGIHMALADPRVGLFLRQLQEMGMQLVLPMRTSSTEEAGEKLNLGNFEELLSRSLPPCMRRLVERQRETKKHLKHAGRIAASPSKTPSAGGSRSCAAIRPSIPGSSTRITCTISSTLTGRRATFKEPDVEEARGEYVYAGCDLKPALPFALFTSVVVGALCTALVQIPLFCRLQKWSQAEAPLTTLDVGLAAVTVVLMGYCSLADPGQLKKTRNVPLDGIDLEQGERPFRAHESWQYGRKIRRYDHYCKWVHNVIGLLNHREFVVLLVCLCMTGLFGIVLDGSLALLLAQKGMWEEEIAVVSHLAFSVGLLAIEVPIFRIHIGLVSRNELAAEWRHHDNYVANNTSQGDCIPVQELDVEEYNQLYDAQAFIYDKSRNRWDLGCFNNCWTFWCWPRWPTAELGEF